MSVSARACLRGSACVRECIQVWVRCAYGICTDVYITSSSINQPTSML